MKAYKSHRRRLEMAGVCLVAAVLLLPTINKAFHIDDPVYIWIAQHIHQEPTDFFGFDVNWQNTYRPLYEENQNPPGVSYYLALVGLIAGWSEPALHLGMSLMTLAAVTGTYLLAERLTSSPLFATLLMVSTPVFLLSATTVMSDVPALACFIWGVLLWMKGLDGNRRALLVVSAVLIGIGMLTKYIAVCALPLLAACTLISNRRELRALAYLAIPPAMIGAYVAYGYRVYGVNLLGQASAFAASHTTDAEVTSPGMRGLVALAFAGGCLLSTFFYAPLLWKGAWKWIVLGSIPACMVFLLWLGRVDTHLVSTSDEGIRWAFLINAAVFVAAGLHLLALCVARLAQNTDRESWLLALWIFGMFVFAAFVNWTISGRAILFMAPAAAILATKMIDSSSGKILKGARWFPIVPALALSGVVVWSDYRLAEGGRTAADDAAKFARTIEGDLAFQGHWGFQYYIEQAGFRAYDVYNMGFTEGDVIVIPGNSPATSELPREVARAVHTLAIPGASWCSTMHRRAAAGFYSHFWGPLPYVLGRAPDEEYVFYRIGLYNDAAPCGDSDRR